MALNISSDVFDKFVFENTEFVVINDKRSSNPVLNQKLLLAYVDIVQNKKVILPIKDQDLYNMALDHYITLKEIYFMGE
ncbi:MAG: hypothetical protein IJW59_00845 [Clostridia bacterium]|nr:hypothetical protein [Clostridia bacterium]